MKARLINAYGENAVFEAAEIERPVVNAGLWGKQQKDKFDVILAQPKE